MRKSIEAKRKIDNKYTVNADAEETFQHAL